MTKRQPKDGERIAVCRHLAEKVDRDFTWHFVEPVRISGIPCQWLALCDECDVVIEGFRPGVARRLGIDVFTLRLLTNATADNDGLVKIMRGLGTPGTIVALEEIR